MGERGNEEEEEEVEDDDDEDDEDDEDEDDEDDNDDDDEDEEEEEVNNEHLSTYTAVFLIRFRIRWSPLSGSVFRKLIQIQVIKKH